MVVTTKDFVPTIQQYRDMFNVADLRGRVILSMGLDLGWRISDFLKIEKDRLDLNQETPISMDAITQKCNIIANGKSPIERKTLDFARKTKREWQLHRTTIGVLTGIIALIITFATFILKMLDMF